jgi:hypothetical protein
MTPAMHLHSAIDADGATILDIERDKMVALNPTGGYVWRRLLLGQPIEDIVRELAIATGADIVTVRDDVHVFLKDLKTAHLLEG